MSGIDVGILSVVLILILVYAGMHIGVVLGLVSFGCIWLVRGDVEIAGKMLAMSAADSLAQYEFGVVPLFVLMGLLVSVAEIGRDTYEVANHLFRKVRGGLGSATVVANAVFAAVTGTSIASASVFTKVAVPEMLRYGYNPRFAVGVVAGSSVLGMLIPPSLLFILFGILAETSIGDLFIAGIIPGLLLAGTYCGMIWFMARRYPRMVIIDESKQRVGDSEMSGSEMLSKGVPIVLLILIVLGGLYGGVFTATEAGGVGALGALVLALARRKLTWASFWRVLVETGHVTAAISFLLISAHLYSRMISITGIPTTVDHLIATLDIGFVTLVVVYIVVLLLLGTMLDAGSIMLITIPLVVPVMANFQVDLIWLGVITVLAIEVGLLTPPFGLAVFVTHNNLRDSRIGVNDIFWGAAPFAIVMVLVLTAVAIFPQLALALL
ncbi:MAG: TRAP transporter large permease [Rhodospirillaceae bacterium]